MSTLVTYRDLTVSHGGHVKPGKKRASKGRDKSLGKRLRTIRQESGVSIKAAAPKLGVNYTYLSKIENGYSNPSSAFLNRIAEFYGIDRDQLYAAAQRLPPDVERILEENLDEAVTLLRRRFKGDGSSSA